MSVVTLTADNFRREVLESTLPVVVDFYADWCGPCKQIAPAIETLSEKWAGQVTFAKVDIEAHPDIANGYNVSSIPAVLRFENGAVTRWSLGAKPAYLLERELKLTNRGVGTKGPGEKGLLDRIFGR